MSNQPVIRDERTIAVENASYRLAYTILSFGAMVIVAWRGFVLEQNLWDLLALVILTSALATAYQAVHRIFARRAIAATVVVAVMSGLIASALAFLLSR